MVFLNHIEFKEALQTYFIQKGVNIKLKPNKMAKLRVMNEHMGDFREEIVRLYDYAEQLKTTNPGTIEYMVNWKKDWRGEQRRRKLWQVAQASFEVLLQSKLDDLSELGVGIVEALLKYNKEAWCSAYFKEHSKCDVAENMYETFNNCLLDARFKSIITML
ncbi:hypothetical protein H5410_040902 [Solanum commersonii]|uniref:Uncharacterized protein n=1 Tax=Solanum commersonii TaxID=4109 RepID=A0A9J5XSW3_SOLCO|nr:hypothetical protein H5410_040902 [Solanum commersonii]